MDLNSRGICNEEEISKFSAPHFLHPFLILAHPAAPVYLKEKNCFEEKPIGGIYKESWMLCSSLSSVVADEDWFSFFGMYLLYGTNPFLHVSGLTLTLSWDMDDVSLDVLCTKCSNFPSPLPTCMSRGIGLHASIVGEDGLQVSVTNRVVPKSLRVRPDNSPAVSSLAETHSLGRSSSF